MITKADPGVWCDYCKSRWGRVREGWHQLAQTPATITVHSSNPKSNSPKRHYCNSCALTVTTFTATSKLPGYRWGLDKQISSVASAQLVAGE